MHPRLNYPKASPPVYQALLALQTAVDKSGLDKALLELIKIRAYILDARNPTHHG